MIKKIVVTFLSLATAEVARSNEFKISSCIDCYNFVAPTIYTAETLSTPEVGLVVYDATYGTFRGYNAGGFWNKISQEVRIKTITSTDSVTNVDDVVVADTSVNSTNITVNLPQASLSPGKTILVKKSDSASFNVIVDPYSTETIDGYANISLKFKNDFVEVVSTGLNWITKNQKTQKAPTIQKLTAPSGTYVLPTNPSPIYIRVRMVGGGGGGAGGGTSGSGGGAGGAGGVTSFGSSLLTAYGGAGGVSANSYGGVGGLSSINSPATGTASQGSRGGPSGSTNIGSSTSGFPSLGGNGGTSIFGGAGGGATTGSAGTSAVTNSGSGGGGGSCTATASVINHAGSGGGAGGFVDAIIHSPLSSYAYIVGAGGTSGTNGTSGFIGGAGGTGYIEVTEYYQ